MTIVHYIAKYLPNSDKNRDDGVDLPRQQSTRRQIFFALRFTAVWFLATTVSVSGYLLASVPSTVAFALAATLSATAFFLAGSLLQLPAAWQLRGGEQHTNSEPQN